MKIKNVSFVFTSKPKELFCQPNTLLLLKLPALHRGDNLYGYILRGSQRYSIPISVLSQKPTCHAENIWQCLGTFLIVTTMGVTTSI